MLISGHQKQKSIPPNSQVKIEHKYDAPSAARTVADGYVLIDGEKFKYREVDADEVWEAEAILAANKHSGEWDSDLLRVMVADLPTMDLGLAGFSDEDLDAMKISVPKISVSLPEPESEYDDTEDESEEEVEETDEEYLKNNPGPDSEVHKEIIGENPFLAVEEKTEVEGKKYVLIIDCDNNDHKAELKKKLQEIVTSHGARFF